MKNARIYAALGGLLVLGAAGFGYRFHRAQSEQEAKVAQLVADVDTALQQRPVDGSELSRLVTRLDAIDARDPRVPVAMARIELARGRFERAASHLDPLVGIGASDLAALRVGSQVWLMWAARGGKDPNERTQLAARALQLAESAFRLGASAEDAFTAWQSGVRLPDDAAARRYEDVLQQQFADSLPARTVKALSTALRDPQLRALRELEREWPQPAPLELRLTIAVLQLQNNELEAAAKATRDLLLQEPNLVEVRHWSATVFHVLALATQGAAHDQYVRQRDEQLQWLEANAPAADSRRTKWLELRQQR